ncbi:MAG: hypothetical protein V9E87_05860 [Gemmatimonadales bacterium]
MTCESMLLQLLEAEPDELRRVVDTPLSRHLAGCAKCAAVADRLIADTAQLAFAVRADARVAAQPARKLSRLWLVPGVTAVAAVAMLLWRGGESPVVAPVPVSSVVTPPPAPAVASAPVAVAEAPRSTAPTPRRPLPAQRPMRVQPVPQVVAFRVEPVIVEPEPAPTPVTVTPMPRAGRGRGIVSRGAVTVEPPPTKRATILRSAVPGVTVIWLN